VPQAFDRRKLVEEYEDSLFRLIISDFARAEGEEYRRENEELNKDTANQATPAEIRKFRRVIGRAQRKLAVKGMIKKSYKAFSKATIWIVLVFLVFTGSAMAIQPVRIDVLNFLIGFEKEYTSIKLGGTEGNGIVGDGLYVTWLDGYVPKYIPDGFRITRLSYDESFKSINYLSEDGRMLSYSELLTQTEANLDTENATTVESIFIHGHGALLVEKEGRHSLAWSDGERLFVVIGQISRDEIVEIAKNVTLLQ